MTVWFTGRLTNGVDDFTFDSTDLMSDPESSFAVTDLSLAGAPSWVRTALAAGTLVVELTLTGETDSPLTTGLVVYNVYLKGAPSSSHVVAIRQYPRDDSLGLGSAPRLHPPLRRGRVVGGFQ